MTNQPPDEMVEQVLEEGLKRLRQQPVPTMPTELLKTQASEKPELSGFDHSRTGVPLRRRRRWLAIMTIAASVAVAACCWTIVQWNKKPPDLIIADSPLTETTNEPISLADLKPFALLKANLDHMETEIADLRREAELLDATRKLNSMMVTK